jgi:hypothetical protein
METLLYSADHELLNGQTVVITGTDNYDDQYDIEVIDQDVISIEAEYLSDETGECYPLLDSTYYITFLFGIEELFDEVKLRTAWKAKSLKGAKDGGIIDEIPLTEDRRDLFLHFLKSGAEKVFQKLQAYSKGIVNAYKFNEQIDLDGDGEYNGTTKYIHYTINEDKTYQDENMYEVMDNKIKDALVAYVLKEWYQITTLVQDWQINEQVFNTLLMDIQRASMQAEGHKPIIFNEGFR